MHVLRHKVMAVIFMMNLLMVTEAESHMMVAQHGTINMVNNGAFMVLSLPISAFNDIDDDINGHLSTVEFNSHRAEIITQILAKVKLTDKNGLRPLEGLMFSLGDDHHDADTATQLIVMGRFAIDVKTTDWTLSFDLFGQAAAEKVMSMSVKRKATNQQVAFELTPENHVQKVFSQ
ncbi:hypothetical protein [Shewanella livingstonensis]|uniref:Uncharacterized protein n=1 Tax=Shewanella livingstonensis TaxID=150120 RepID=A0A3G8LVH6_9GAMM|nr:hypothetical protein [Shewanella livingstonensis]AZG73619.1 hypothetical protein EGC82_13110 [Shewanella livingstonensis]